MKTVSLALLALCCTAAEPALSQSTEAPRNALSASLSFVLRLLNVPSRGTAAVPLARRDAPDAVALGLATARVYRFASADYPGASSSYIFDENSSTIVGDFTYNTNNLNASFTLRSNLYRTFTIPDALVGPLSIGINTGGEIVGVYRDFGNVVHGFVDMAGSVTKIDEPSGETTPYDINDSGTIVGAHDSHGFSTTDDGVSFSDFDVPGATTTMATGINTSGVIVGAWTDSSTHTHGFLLSGGVFQSLDFPLAAGTTAMGINDSNEIAGSFSDAAGVSHGFIYSAGAYIQVDVAGASATVLTRIKNNGHVTGAYADSTNEVHGLTGH
jgi:hypothetical protein